MKNVLSVVALISLTFFIGSCNTKNTEAPKTVLVNFFDALGKNDIESAKKLATPEAKSLLDKMASMFDSSKSANTEPNSFEKSNISLGEAKIEGDSATIPTTFKDLNQTINTILKKESGVWKVNWNLDFMLQLSEDNTNEKKVDSLSIDQIRNMDIDSFDAAMKKGLPAADSMLKKLQEN